jgi:hypothetical protein
MGAKDRATTKAVSVNGGAIHERPAPACGRYLPDNIPSLHNQGAEASWPTRGPAVRHMYAFDARRLVVALLGRNSREGSAYEVEFDKREVAYGAG